MRKSLSASTPVLIINLQYACAFTCLYSLFLFKTISIIFESQMESKLLCLTSFLRTNHSFLTISLFSLPSIPNSQQSMIPCSHYSLFIELSALLALLSHFSSLYSRFSTRCDFSHAILYSQN